MLLTSLVYLENQGDVLMLYRNKKQNDVNEGKWIGIGGKFEADERPIDCAIREVHEETGQTPERLNFRGVVTFVYPNHPTTYMFLYTGMLADRNVVANDEGTMHWVPRDEILDLNLWKGDRIFLKQLATSDAPIDLKLRYNEKDELIEVKGGDE
ncbi:MAG: NUDIX domain-containing protein [Aerococcus sp.]|nr:NUDIX domain-containing protein [Aerococcus sp.]